MSDLKTELGIVAGLCAHQYGYAATARMLQNISVALRCRAAPELPESPEDRPMAATMREIVKEVADETGYTIEDLRGRSRKRDLCEARFECWERIYTRTGASYPQIGAYFGRHHVTIMYGADPERRVRMAGEAWMRRQK